MPGPDRIEGLAIVSADGMIADAHGVQPDALRIDADQQFLFATLKRATAVAHGRYSGEGGADAARRHRLVVTRRVPAWARDPDNDKALLWNPAGASLAEAWVALGLSGGLLTVIGGTEVFGMFLEMGYDAFHLSCAQRVKLPGGRPVFPGIPPATPDELLARHGLKPEPMRVLDGSADITLATWRR